MFAPRRAILVALVLVGLLVSPAAGTAPATAGRLTTPVGPPAAFAPHPANHKLSGIVFADDEQNGEPRNTTDTFDAGTGRVYAFFDFANLGPDEPVSGVWYLGSRVLLTQRHTLREIFRGNAPDEGTLWFHAQISGGFSPGFYRLEISVNDQIDQSGGFEVRQPPGLPLLANAFFTRRIAGSPTSVAYPVTYESRFDLTTARIYAVFDHFEMDAAQSWGWRLSRDGQVLDQSLNRTWTVEPSGTFAFPLALPRQSGVYDLDLFLDENWVAAESFVVGRPEPAEDRLVSHDDFTDPGSGWGTVSDADGRVDYEDDQLVVEIDGTDPGWSSSGHDYADGITEIEAVPVNVTHEVNEATGYDQFGYWGVLARYQDRSNFYGFVMSPNGQYAVFHMLEGELVFDRDWTQALGDVIPPGLQKRTLRLLASGPVLRFYVDGRLVDAVSDAAWTEGQSGVIAGTLGDYPVKVDFDNWRLWNLEGRG